MRANNIMQIQPQMNFSTEKREEIIKYLKMLVKEIDRTLEEMEEKKDALYMLDMVVKGEIDVEDEELAKKLKTKKDKDNARKRLEEDIRQIQEEFGIIDTLFTSIFEELRKRFG